MQRKQEIYKRYKAELPEKDVCFLEDSKPIFSNRWLSCVLFKNTSLRDQVKKHLDGLNIESRFIWKPMHLQPLYKTERSFLNGNAQKIFNDGLCLPSDVNMSDNDQLKVIKEIKKCVLKSIDQCTEY